MPSQPVTRGATLRAAALLTLLLGATACDLPTAVPRWETTWGLRTNADSVTIADFLPADVTLNAGAFQVAPPTVTATLDATTFCGGPCPAGTLPKTAFTTSVTAATAVAADLVQATLSGPNNVRVRVTQDFGFDLLQPAGAAAAGTLTLVLLTRESAASAWDTLAVDVLTGADASLPDGVTLERTIAIPAAATLKREIGVVAVTASPAGAPVTYNPSGQFRVTGDVADGLRIGATTLMFAPRTVTGNGTTLDLSGLDVDEDRLTGATLTLALQNPLAVVGTGTLRFTRDDLDVIAPRAFAFTAGASTSTVTLSAADLQMLRAAAITVTPSFSVRAAADDQITVRPADVIGVRATFLATVRPAGTP